MGYYYQGIEIFNPPLYGHPNFVISSHQLYWSQPLPVHPNSRGSTECLSTWTGQSLSAKRTKMIKYFSRNLPLRYPQTAECNRPSHFHDPVQTMVRNPYILKIKKNKKK